MKRPTMSGSLYRLIYCSRNVRAEGQPDGARPDNIEHEIQAILATSRRRNREDTITGALLFTASGFAQVLEGPREAVERTLDRITADPRHTDVTVLSFTPTERRCFPEWAMGFCSHYAPNLADPLAPMLADTMSGGPRVTRGSDVLRLVESLVKQENEWVAA